MGSLWSIFAKSHGFCRGEGWEPNLGGDWHWCRNAETKEGQWTNRPMDQTDSERIFFSFNKEKNMENLIVAESPKCQTEFNGWSD